MLVGIPQEIKKSEFRVAAIPAGVKTPRLVTRKMLQLMRKESVIVDVAS